MKIFMALTLILLTTYGNAQVGTVRESLKMESEVLGKEVAYSVYLPPGYGSSDRKFPVLYLLHGYTDDETAWTQFGEVNRIMDKALQNTDVTPMIMAMPDAGVDWYINSHDGKTRYEDFFIEEFIPFIESTYRARGTAEFRAVAGLSMGGHGTLIYALKHPDKFAAAAPLSAAAWGAEWPLEHTQEDWDEYFGFVFGEGYSGEERMTDHLRDNLPLFLVESRDPEELKKVKWYIDCGDDDFLVNGNMELHRIMREKEIPHEFRIRDGSHNWEYWRTALPEVLKFVSQSFHR